MEQVRNHENEHSGCENRYVEIGSHQIDLLQPSRGAKRTRPTIYRIPPTTYNFVVGSNISQPTTLLRIDPSAKGRNADEEWWR